MKFNNFHARKLVLKISSSKYRPYFVKRNTVWALSDLFTPPLYCFDPVDGMTTITWSKYVVLGLYSLSGRTSYRKISRSLEAARFRFKLFQSLWNLTGTSAAALPRCLSRLKVIRPSWHPISRLRDFMISWGKTSVRLVNGGHVS